MLKILPLRYPHVLHADWANPGSVLPSANLRRYAWKVPAEIMRMIPASVKEILQCEDQSLVVLRNIHVADYFAGQARIARWSELLGLTTAAIDRDHSSHLDLCSDEGLATAICTLLRVREGGLCFMGPQCSSWIWLSRSTTRRSAADPDGDLSLPTVREGNHLNKVVALLVTIAGLAGISWVIEQPSSSLFFHTQIMRSVILEVNPFQRWLSLNKWGHFAQKSTLLIGVAGFLSNMGKELSKQAKKRGCGKASKASAKKAESKASSTAKAKAKAKVAKTRAATKAKAKKVPPSDQFEIGGKLATHKRDKNGKIKVTGNPEALKKSQVYPPSFALDVVRSHWPDEISC